MNSGSERISGNCQSVLSVPTSILSFVLFFRKSKALYTSNSLFCAPLRTFYPEKDGWGFGFAVTCLPGVTHRERHPSAGTGQTPSASARLLFPFSTCGAEGDGDKRTGDCLHLPVFSVKAHRGRDCLKGTLSAVTVLSQVNKASLYSRGLMSSSGVITNSVLPLPRAAASHFPG